MTEAVDDLAGSSSGTRPGRRIWLPIRPHVSAETEEHVSGSPPAPSVAPLGDPSAMTVAAVAEQAPVALVAAAIVTAGVLASAWHGVAYTEIASMAGKNRAGAALGLENTTVFAAAFLTPVMIPVVLHLAGWWAVWAAAAVTSLVAVPLAPRRERVIILPPAMS